MIAYDVRAIQLLLGDVSASLRLYSGICYTRYVRRCTIMVGNVGDERALKDIVIKVLDERCDELVELSLSLHANP